VSNDSVIFALNPSDKLFGRARARALDDVALENGVAQDVCFVGEGREGGRKGGLSKGNGDFKSRNNRKEKKRICRKGDSKNRKEEILSHYLTHQH